MYPHFSLRATFILTHLEQREKKEFNLVLIIPDDGSVEAWDVEGSADKMREDYADFEPRYVSV